MRRPLPHQLLSAAVLLFVAHAVACAGPTDDAATPAESSEDFTSGAAGSGAAGAPANENTSAPSNGGSTLGEPPQAPVGETACDGLDDNGNGLIDEGCACTAGQTRACYDGPASTRNVGTCSDGTQTCEGSGASSTWGECIGSVGPTADVEDGADNDCDGTPDNAPQCGSDQPTSPERCDNGVDDDCDGALDCLDTDCAAAPSCQEVCNDGVDNNHDGRVDCADPACTTAPNCYEDCTDGIDNDGNGRVDCADSACATAPNCQEVCHDFTDNDNDGLVDCQDPDCSNDVDCNSGECNLGGTVYVNNLWYCDVGTSPYGIHLWSGLAWGYDQGCGLDFGTGGTFTAKCAGTYEVCARVVAKSNNCTVTKQCVTVVVPNDNGTVNLPPFPGFANVTGACADATYAAGGHTCIDMSGTTFDNISVSKNNIVCMADFTWGGNGTGSGSGGGSY